MFLLQIFRKLILFCKQKLQIFTNLPFSSQNSLPFLIAKGRRNARQICPTSVIQLIVVKFDRQNNSAVHNTTSFSNVLGRDVFQLYMMCIRCLKGNWHIFPPDNIINRVSKNNQNYFCYSYIKLPPNLTIFGTKMTNGQKLYEVHSFPTSPNFVNALPYTDVPNCYITL